MSTMAFRVDKSHKQVTLSITPLIDVLFLLVIFFMLTGTFKRVGELELQLPGSSTSTPVSEEDMSRQVELLVSEDGLLTLDGEIVQMPQLKSRLLAILRADPQSSVMIKAAEKVEHGQVVLLLDIVRDAGFPGVGIGTRMKPAQEEAPE
jgi:biopolymer transport protein ExbD